MNQVGDRLVALIRRARLIGLFCRIFGLVAVSLVYAFLLDELPLWLPYVMIPLAVYVPARIAHEITLKGIICESQAVQQDKKPFSESNALLLISMSNDPSGMDPRYRDHVFEVIERSDFSDLARHKDAMARFAKRWHMFRVDEAPTDIWMNRFVSRLASEPGVLPEDLRLNVHRKLVEIGSVCAR